MSKVLKIINKNMKTGFSRTTSLNYGTIMKYGVIVIFIFLILSTMSCTDSPRPDKPNVVLLLADDLGWQDLGCYDIDEPTPYESPNIDKFSTMGVNSGKHIRLLLHAHLHVGQFSLESIRSVCNAPMLWEELLLFHIMRRTQL